MVGVLRLHLQPAADQFLDRQQTAAFAGVAEREGRATQTVTS